ncbi:hypothetical protein [Roseovarius sp. EL26]|uniref:hypothetical protein n=1 Tax=Roseovarius sp. EL26 TaxID=2126672 RepID=UPI000EA13CEE|nr:hypothetical protein [Roseovarius sp. EL26]
MYEIDQILPEHVLLGRSEESIAETLDSVGGIWFLAGEPHFRFTPCKANPDLSFLHKWHARVGDTTALPVKPNREQGKATTYAGSDCLAFSQGLNGGFHVPKIADDNQRFSCAIRFAAPDNDARTLLTVNLESQSNYIFITQNDGKITAKDDKGCFELSTETNTHDAGFQWLILSLDGETFSLRSQNGAVHNTQARNLDFDGPARLFIGCRSHRKGLLKTLGHSFVSDVFFWPELNILDPRSAVGSEQLECINALDGPGL